MARLAHDLEASSDLRLGGPRTRALHASEQLKGAETDSVLVKVRFENLSYKLVKNRGLARKGSSQLFLTAHLW